MLRLIALLSVQFSEVQIQGEGAGRVQGEG